MDFYFFAFKFPIFLVFFV